MPSSFSTLPSQHNNPFQGNMQNQAWQRGITIQGIKRNIFLSGYLSFSVYDGHHEMLESNEWQCRNYILRLLIWAVKWQHKVCLLSSDQCRMCVFLKHMVYAVSVWQKHLCLKYSLTVPCHLAKQCGLFRTNLLWLTTERCMCVSEPLPMNRQRDHLGTWHLHIFEQS